jgi:hypothetical protein
MLRIVPIALALAVALSVTAPAKEFAGGKLCGRDGCHSLVPLGEAVVNGSPAGPPRRAEPYLLMRVRFRGEGHSVLAEWVFLPASGLVTGDGVTWSRPDAVESLRRTARGLTPFPAKDLPYPTQDDQKTATVPKTAAGSPPGRRGGGGGAGGGDGAWWVAVVAGSLAIGAGWVVVRRRWRPAPGPPA